MSGQPSFCGVILAAGNSSRMGRDKALLPWPPGSQSGTFLSRAVDVLTATTQRVIVVAGENEASLRAVVFARAGYLLRNPDPSQGQFSSLRVGLQAVLDSGHDGAVVMLVDRPPVLRATIESLKSALTTYSEEDVWAVVPSFGGEHGHPMVMGRDMMEAFLRASAGSTAKDIRTENESHVRYVDLDDANVVRNVNTPEEYAQASQNVPGESA